ncbi:CoA ester lyase [Ruegeria sediminis]|uniref:CoA ester lyase n=1 Tax=Ruegeria sediminis TaxID=2583820 RepID=A0ABY2WTV7_9RHOB|nr:CoA ester lyase [Ruegeria sediminis]TMV04264.1 CoA ester lyase [Ruegeria sediminis]
MNSAVTYLFVPGDRPERFEKALGSGADRIIIDLEDAVRPERKAEARAGLVEADIDWSRVVVRINDAASPHFAADLDCVASAPAAAFMLPKAETTESLTAVRQAAGRKVELLPQIETARGLDRLQTLLAVPDVRRAAFGHLDFALDLGAAPDWDALALVRSELVLRSRLAGAEAPIDSVTPDIKDTDKLRLESETARRFGFGGKLLIHPAQVATVALAFAPSPAECDWAERVLAALAEGGAGAVAVDGKMVDKPVEDAARRILARAGRTTGLADA